MPERPPLPPLKDDGLPTLPTGEPVLQRWFVLTLLLLTPVTIGVTIWAFASIDREMIGPAERRPAGDSVVTVERGQAQLATTMEAEPGPGCGQAVRLIGDAGSRAAARVALAGACQLIDSGRFPLARAGLVRWIAADGWLRIATFELAGVESSARLEAGRIVIELNAKFQFDDAVRAAPALLQQLVLLSDQEWPGAPVGASTALEAALAEHESCLLLAFDEPPRGCSDVAELLDRPDPRAELLGAGYRDDR